MTTNNTYSSVGAYTLRSSRAVQGIVCVEAGMLFFVAQDALMKVLLDTYSIWLLLFVRSVIAVLVLVPLITLLGAPHRILSPFWPLHVARGVLFAGGFSLFYAAFPFMGLAEVSTIFFSAPLFTALMATIFLGEKIGWHRSGALLVGFSGVLIAMNPAAGSFNWVSVLPLLCAVAYSASQVIARRIGERESSLSVGLQTLFFAGVAILPMGWLVNTIIPIGPEYPHLFLQIPSPPLPYVQLVVLIGCVGMCGYILLSRAYQIAEASLVAPFDYTYLPLAAALGYFLWGEVPPQSTFYGMILIVSAGLYLGYRELRATAGSDEVALVGETVFAPASLPMTQIPEDEQSPPIDPARKDGA
ncbi:MAG: DMT family transporter [Pseudomonadota bacterium]